MTSYKEVTFKDLSAKRKETVREKIEKLWADGYTAEEISKKVRISKNSCRTAMGNLSRKYVEAN